MLASALEFGSAAAPALTVLLKMGSWLPADQFSTKVCHHLFCFCSIYILVLDHPVKMVCGLVTHVENTGPFQVLPTIVKLFASNDRAIRVSLLQHIDQFGESLASQTVDEQVCGLFLYGHMFVSECSHLTG